MNIVREWITDLIEHRPHQHKFPMFAIGTIPDAPAFVVLMGLESVYGGGETLPMGIIYSLN